MEDFNKLEEEYYKRKHQEWVDLINEQIKKILYKVNSLLPAGVKIERTEEIENTIKECMNEIHRYTCKEMIDPD